MKKQVTFTIVYFTLVVSFLVNRISEFVSMKGGRTSYSDAYIIGAPFMYLMILCTCILIVVSLASKVFTHKAKLQVTGLITVNIISVLTSNYIDNSLRTTTAPQQVLIPMLGISVLISVVSLVSIFILIRRDEFYIKTSYLN